MASSGNEAFDKNAAAKKNFLRKFGRRMGNVFTRKRTSRGEMEDVSAPVLLPSGPPGDSNVVINPLMGADLPSASVYQSSKSYPINVSSNIRSKGGGGGLITGNRLSGEIPTVSSAMSEESVTGAGLPPERCLSEGNLVDSSPSNKDQLGGFGGRIWRAVPGSMENLPKSLQTELASKVGSRGYSISEDEGLPHSPSDNAEEEKSSRRARASSQGHFRSDDRLGTPLGPQASKLSQSSRSLMSCDGSSDGEHSGAQSLDLDFNALRRAESLDNTAAKHRIQVSRPRKARSSGNAGGGLRKHKSMSTVQLSEISEEVVPDEPLRRRAPSSDLLMTKNFSPAASQLAQELAQMQRKKEERSATKPSQDSTPPSSASSPAPLTVSRVVKPSSAGDSKVTKLRSMFGRSTSIESPSEPVKSPTKPKTAAPDPKPQIFFSATATAPNKGFAKGFGVSGPPSSSPVKVSGSPRPKPAVPRKMSFPEPRKAAPNTAPVKKFSVDVTTARSSVFKSLSGNTPSPPVTDKSLASSKTGVELREKKPLNDTPCPAAKKTDEEADSGRRVSTVKDLVKNFQRLQETTSG